MAQNPEYEAPPHPASNAPKVRTGGPIRFTPTPLGVGTAANSRVRFGGLSNVP